MELTTIDSTGIVASILLAGYTGVGKSYTAFALARSLVNNDLSKICVINTEGYSPRFNAGGGTGKMKCVNLSEFKDGGFSARNLKEAMRMAVESGAEVIIVDSLSSFWSGKGGVIDMHERIGEQASLAAQVEAKMANPTMTKELLTQIRAKDNPGWWNVPKGENMSAIQYIVDAPVHTICTLRTKASMNMKTFEWDADIIVQDKLTPFMFSFYFLIGSGHIAVTEKDRTGTFARQFYFTENTGTELIAAMNNMDKDYGMYVPDGYISESLKGSLGKKRSAIETMTKRTEKDGRVVDVPAAVVKPTAGITLEWPEGETFESALRKYSTWEQNRIVEIIERERAGGLTAAGYAKCLESLNMGAA